MNDNNEIISEKSEVLDNLGKQPDDIDRITAIRVERRKENAAWEEKYKKAVDQNIDLGDKVEELTNSVNNLALEKKALEKSLWRERTQTNISQEKELSEGQKVGNMALEIIRRRCQERWGGRK
jgi:predicted nuclease with TOPRIM domain